MKPDTLSVWLGITCVVVVTGARLASQSLSFSTDFDGRGTGTSITIDKPGLSTSGPRSSSRTPADPALAEILRHLDQRYAEQSGEVERQVEAQRLQKQLNEEETRSTQNIDRVRSIKAELERLQGSVNNEPSALNRMRDIQRVLDLQNQFESARSSYLSSLPSYQQKLARSLSLINVPPPAHPLHYQRILIWGLMSTPEQAHQAVLKRRADPFNGMPYDDVFAFGSEGAGDWLRVGLDHLLGLLDRLSPQTADRIGQLRGATVDELVCHSNGCRVAEVLIATGQLKVARLRMLGADNAAWELDGLVALKRKSGIQEVSLYLTKGDIVPLVEPGWEIRKLMLDQIKQPLQTFSTSHSTDSTYQFLGLTNRSPFSATSDVHVHVLSLPQAGALDAVTRHRYDSYSNIIEGLRLGGCLSPDGTYDRCILR